MECSSLYPKPLKQNIRRSVKYSKEEVTKKTLIEVFPVMENKRVEEHIKKDIFLMNISCIFQNIRNLLNIKHKDLIDDDKLQWLQEVLDLSILYRNEENNTFYLRKIIFGIMNFLWTNAPTEEINNEDKDDHENDDKGIEEKTEIQTYNKDTFEKIMNIYSILKEETNNLVVQLNGLDFLFQPKIKQEKHEAVNIK